MIVKILKSSGGFPGLDYNQEKVEKQEAKLMAAENFDGVLAMPGKEPSMKDYQNHLEVYSNRNSVVKNKQFHVAISAKGASMNHTQLMEAGKEYLKEMGYDKQPYLIYSHHDTPNNHIHIVTSRIDENGKKINDSFEKMRSQAFVKEYLGIDYNQEITGVVKEANKYRFQTTGQYLSVLEQLGVRTTKNDDKVELYKHGEKMQEISLNDIEKYINKDYDKSRAKQFTAVFYKYSENLNQIEFQKALKEKLGASVIFHTSKDKNKPYGFTLIDNKNKAVFKGSQILKLDTLLERFNRVEEKRKSFDITGFLSNAVDQSKSYKEFKDKLSKEGFEVDKKGVVSYKNGNEIGFTLEDDVLKDLKYQDRVNAAKSFAVSSELEKDLLAKIFFINKADLADLKLSQDQNGNYSKDYYETLLETLSANEESLKSQLSDLKMELVDFKGEQFIIDREAKNISKVDVEFTEQEKEDIKLLDSFFDKEKGEGFERELNNNSLSEEFKLSGVVDTISSLFYYGGEEENQQKKKKKKGITR